ncbi:MAG: Asp-tRNA(Asn)/Glu-tRNA(Gln) amidotransferase subunit GatC [Janthinobacterium lividum]
MSLNSNDVTRLADLARIAISEQENARMLAQLNDLFALIERMQAVDTDGVEPLSHPIEQIQAVAQRLREDQVTEAVERERLQAPAPALENGLYLVPKVIE